MKDFLEIEKILRRSSYTTSSFFKKFPLFSLSLEIDYERAGGRG
jgi:hypothetical protein